MAGIGSGLRKKVEGSTILEVIISMVIIVCVFGIAMMIYTNVSRSSLSVKTVNAEATLEKQMSVVEKDSLSSDNTININGFKVEQKITPYQNIKNLSWVQLTAYDSTENKAAELNKVIYNNK
jgi:type II secretory pathway component PulJ